MRFCKKKKKRVRKKNTPALGTGNETRNETDANSAFYRVQYNRVGLIVYPNN